MSVGLFAAISENVSDGSEVVDPSPHGLAWPGQRDVAAGEAAAMEAAAAAAFRVGAGGVGHSASPRPDVNRSFPQFPLMHTLYMGTKNEISSVPYICQIIHKISRFRGQFLYNKSIWQKIAACTFAPCLMFKYYKKNQYIHSIFNKSIPFSINQYHFL